MRFVDAFFMWMICRFSIRGDKIPETYQVVGAVGIGTNRKGTGPNSRSKKLAETAADHFPHPARTMLFLGGNGRPGLTESEAMLSSIRLRVPARYVITDTRSHNTFTNAVEACGWLKRKGYKSAVFFAEAWHARRVRLTFRRVFEGSEISVYVVPVVCPYDADSSGVCIRPSSFFFYEIGAFVYSFMKGWV